MHISRTVDSALGPLFRVYGLGMGLPEVRGLWWPALLLAEVNSPTMEAIQPET